MACPGMYQKKKEKKKLNLQTQRNHFIFHERHATNKYAIYLKTSKTN